MGKYKFSQFNSLVPVTDETEVIYNALSDRFMLLRKGVVKERLEDIAGKKELMENLVKGGFIIEESTNEIDKVKELSHKVDHNEERFNLIINPTLNCNFRCWYCYETKTSKSLMTANVMRNVQSLIKKTAPLHSVFDLSFFGGEPLLGYNRIVKPLLAYTNDVCRANNTRLNVSFTSNGYLITREMVQLFKENNVKSFQITLDGNRRFHNETRYPKKGVDSYSKIIENIKLLLEYGISVILRFNYTDKNIGSLTEVVDDIEDINPNNRKLLNISFHQVWQNADIDLGKDIENVVEYFSSKGFNASTPVFDNVRNSCYADKKNNALINFNGDVFKCTAVDFENTVRDGFLSEDGTIVWENDSLNVRLNSKFKNMPCLKCRLLPICNGACTQKALEYKSQDYCICHNDEERKNRIVLDKFRKYISCINKM